MAVTCPLNTGSEYRCFFLHCSLWSWSTETISLCQYLKWSELKEGLESPMNTFNLPEEEYLPGDNVPDLYYIVRDNAFRINKRLINPFSIRNMEHHEIKFKSPASDV